MFNNLVFVSICIFEQNVLNFIVHMNYKVYTHYVMTLSDWWHAHAHPYPQPVPLI